MANYHDPLWIRMGLQNHFEEATKDCDLDDVFALVLRGSQNYGLDNQNSDIDSRCIFIPRNMNEPVQPEREIMLENGEQITFIDIRLFIHGLQIRSLYYLELLYSDFYVCPREHYLELWHRFQVQAGPLVDSNRVAAAESILFYADKKLEYLFDNFRPERRDLCLQMGYDAKSLYHLARYHGLLKLLATGESFDKCCDEDFNEQFRPIKECHLSLDNAQWLVPQLMNEMTQYYEEIKANYQTDERTCYVLENLIAGWGDDLIKERELVCAADTI